MKNLILLVIGAVSIYLFPMTAAHATGGPSFDCKRASSVIEKAICASPSLAEKDQQLADLYHQFLNGLPESARSDARQMQRLWVKNRGIRCEKKRRYFLDGLLSNKDKASDTWYYVTKTSLWEDQSITDPLPAANSVSTCVSQYYDYAIRSLKKDTLSAEIYFVAGVSHYEIDVHGIKSLEIKMPQTGSSVADGEDIYKVQLYLDAGGNRSLLDDSETDYGTGDMVLALRLFMLQDGTFAAAYKKYEFSTGGAHCNISSSLGLTFFDIKNNEPHLYSGGDRTSFGEFQKGVPIFDTVESCDPYQNKLLSWQANGGTLDFLYRDESNLGVTGGLPAITNYSVNPKLALIKVDQYLDASVDSFMGQSYSGMWKEFDTNRRMLSGKDTLNCVNVNYLLGHYLDLKAFASNKNLSMAQITYLLNKVWEPGKFDNAVHEFAPLGKIFLTYLSRARSVDNWQEKMKQAIAQNTAYLGNDPDQSDYGFIAKAGFPTEGGCMVSTRSPAAGLSLEDWIYQFWYRRAQDGTLKQTETWLNKAIKINASLEAKGT